MMPKITMFLFFVAAIAFCFYGYYQIEFLQQQSWISAEAFRLQDIYFKWAGIWFVAGWGGIIYWRIVI